MLRDIPKKIKIKNHYITIIPTSDYSCDAVCKNNSEFSISEDFTEEEKRLNKEEYLKSYNLGEISYRKIMWDCWERLEKRLRKNL